MKKLSLLSLSTIIACNHLKAIRIVFIAMLLSLTSYTGFAAVTVTPGSGGTNICSNVATSPTTLGPITISEGSMNDFPAGASQLVLTPPAGWTFVVAIPTINAAPGNDVSIGVISITPTLLTINFNATGITHFDVVTISNLQIQATTVGSAAGNIYCSSDAGIAGITTGAAGTNFGSLSIFTAVTPSVLISASPSNVVCAGTTVTFTPAPTNATAPTYQWYVNGICGACVPSPTFSSSSLTTGQTVQAVMSSFGSCQTTGTASSNTINMTVNSNPTITATALPASLCVGSTLTLTSVPAGGGGGNTYAWSNPGGFSAAVQNTTNPNITFAGAGVYSVTVTDINGCKGTGTTASVTVNSNPTITATATPTPLCVGSTLTLNSVPVGGGGGNTYAWSNPGGFSSGGQNKTNPNITVSGAGVYSVTVTDVNGCKGTGTTASVTVNTNPTITATATPNPICVGATLTLNSVPVGGGGGNVYAWSGPGGFVSAGQNTTKPNIAAGGAGIYSVTVTDVNTCKASATTLFVTVNTNPTISATATPNPLCAGSTLSLNSTPAGGSGSYPSYIWNGPGAFAAGTQNASNFAITAGGAGIYTVTVTDGNGCQGQGNTASVTVNPNPTITVFANPNPICVNNTLALTSNPAGGSAPYSYVWTGPNSFSAGVQNTSVPAITTAGAGVYSVALTDNNGCKGSGTTSFVTVNTNPAISATATPNPICVGSTLALNSTVAGGTAPYTYSWTGPGAFAAGTQNTTNPAITLGGAGVYSFTVTDFHGCQAFTTTASVVVNTNPTLTATALPNPICVGATLNLSSTPSGGSGVYPTYVWHGPGAFLSGGQNTTNPAITVGGAGIYSVTVTDGNGCLASATTTAVVVNTNPTITATALPNPLCVGNTLNLNSIPAGGSGIYSYSWTGPNLFAAATQTATIPGIATSGAGVYSMTVTDSHGCTGSGVTASVVVNTNPTISATATPNPICVGNTLNLNSTPLGGSGTYTTFAWNGPTAFSAATQNTTRAAIALTGAGIYTITVTDNHGCQGQGNTPSVTVNANPIVAATALANPICVGSTLNLNANPSGGSGTYIGFAWTGPNGYTAATQTAAIPAITLLGAGVYSVTVTDNNGCSGSNITAAVVVNPTPTISATATPNPICVGSTLALNSTPVGGTAPYLYSWTGPGAFAAGTQNTTNPAITVGGAGVYSVALTDFHGCQASATTASVTVNTNPTLTATALPNPICVGVTLNLSATPSGGSSGVYPTFIWHGPGAFASGGQNTTNPAITLGGAGIYSVTVTDGNGCLASTTTTAVVVNTNPTITATALPSPLCVGSTLNLNSIPAGGSGIYSYSWTGPNLFTAATQTATIPAITTSGAGVYSMTVTDSHGCTGSGVSAPVVVNTNPTISATATPNPICVGNTLNLNSTPAGGSGIYTTFLWNGPAGFVAGTQNTTRAAIALTGAGVYTITVTDNNTCKGTIFTPSVVVNANPLVAATALANPICVGSTLNLNANPSGGSGIYPGFAWTGPNGYTAATQAATVPAISLLGAGVYSVTVTDNNGCTGSNITLAVVVNTNPTITAAAAPNPICVGSTLTLTSIPAGGSGVYPTYAWTGPAAFVAATQNTTRPAIATIGAGIYSITVTDSHGCIGSATTASVTVNTNPTITATATPNPICVGNTLALNSTPAGGSGTYSTFAWTGPTAYTSTVQNASRAAIAVGGAGVYSITVTDNNGCQGFATTASVTVNVNPTITATATPNPICVGNTLVLNSTPLGGSGVYTTYAWNGPGGYSAATQGATISSIATTGAGIYSITVTDSHGCGGIGTTTSVTVNVNPSITATATPTPICTGSTLALNSTPAGGSGIYSSFAWSGPGPFAAATQNASNVAITLAGAGVYSVSVTDNNGCIGSTTTASVTVNASPTISATATPNPICAGNTLALNSTPAGGSGVYTAFAWSGPAGFATAIQNTTIPAIAVVSSGVYSVTVTDNNGCQGAATTASVVVNPLPVQYTITGGGSYCSGGAGVHIGLNGSQAGVNYQLFDGVTPGITIPGTGGVIDFGLFTTAGGPYTAVATNTVTACTNNMISSVTVTILPLPAVFNVTGTGSYCSGGTGVHVGLDGSVTGFNYQLYRGAVLVGGAMAGTGSAIDFGLQTTAGTYTVLATNAISGCTKVMNGSATVTILPLPTVYTVAGGGTLCAGSAGFHVGLSNSDLGINYQLYNGSSTVGAPVAGTGGALDFGIFTTAGTYTVNATNTVTGCINNMTGSAVFIVNPVPVVFNVSGGGGYCAGGTGVIIGLTGSEVGVNYQLFRASTATGLPVAGTGSAITFGLQTVAGTYTVSATKAITLCTSNMSGSTVIVINPNPVVYAVTGTGNYCVGGIGLNIGLTGSDLGVNYQPVVGGLPFGSAVPGTGIAGAFTIGIETAGTYSVVATNPITGCTSNMTGNAIIGTNPLPNVYAVTGGGAYCAGGAGVDVGLANSTAGISYQLYNGGSAVGSPTVSVTTGSAIDFGFQTAAGTYSVQATNTVTGCINDMFGNAVIIMNPLPDAITGAASVCTGSTTLYTDDTTGGIWSSVAPGVADVGSATGIVTGMGAGSTTIVYTLPTGCFVTTPILVNQTPAITGITSVCVGLTNTLSSSLAGGTWSNTNTTIATVNTLTGVVTGVSSGVDNITYSMPTGCFNKVLETVNPLPFVPAITATTTTVCVNSSITYANTILGGVWSSGNTSIANVSATGIVTGMSAGATTITYKFTNIFGCSSQATLGVTVNPIPAVAIMTGPADVCAGATITMSDATPGGVWSSSNNTIATVNSSGVVTGIAFGSVTISYTVTNSFNCSTSTLYSLPVGNPMPASAILPVGSATLCGGNPVHLSVVSSGSPASYQWSDNGTNISGATSSTYTATTAGTYDVTIGNGTCELTLTSTNIVAPPAPVIVYDTVLNQLYTGSFTTYQWYFNGNAISGATGNLITGLGNGVYKVVVSDANGCHDTATFTLGTVGIVTQHVAKEVRIYPNPTTSILYIDAPGKVFVSVLSPDGKVLIERKEAISINVSQLADGLYMIIIYDENNTLLKTDRFVKMQ